MGNSSEISSQSPIVYDYGYELQKIGLKNCQPNIRHGQINKKRAGNLQTPLSVSACRLLARSLRRSPPSCLLKRSAGLKVSKKMLAGYVVSSGAGTRRRGAAFACDMIEPCLRFVEERIAFFFGEECFRV